MSISAARPPRRASLAVVGAALATACLSRSGHTPVPPATPDCEVAPGVPAGQPFTVAGVARYDFVPARYDPTTDSGTLDFSAAAVEQRPIREAAVEIRQCETVLATTATDASGRYSATFSPGPKGRVLVTVLAKTASPPIQVQDNTDGDAVWAVGQPLDAATPTLDVRATHGWTGAGYDASQRIAGPFAILDAIYTAEHRLLAIPRAVAFDLHPVVVNWSPRNVPALCATPPSFDPGRGCINGTFYVPESKEIFVLGAEGQDTDEFDREVIVHEWGHYLEDNFSRSDSPGGPHGFGDVLDPRLSFSEGFASAFAAIVLDQPIYADTFWSDGRIEAFGWDVETSPSPTDDPSPGPFSELTVIRALWDLHDPANESWDGIALGVGPIYDTLVGPQRTTPALTTVASFVAGLKAQGVDGAAVDAVLAHYGIGPIASAFGDGDSALRAMYEPVTVPSSTSADLDAHSFFNERAQNRYYVFTADPGVTHVTVKSTSKFDVDLYAAHAGELLAVADSPSSSETIGFPTVPGETYVIVLTGFGGAPWAPPPPVGSVYTATVEFSAP